MMFETPLAILNVTNDSTLVILKEPRQCECGRMVYFVVNRKGKTRCVECDATCQENKYVPV